MTARRAVWVVTGLVVAGLGAVFGWIGLDKADQAASVAGALAGVLGVGLSLSMLLTGRREGGTVPTVTGVPTTTGAGDRLGRTGASTRPADAAPPSQEAKYQIDISNAEGVQIGDSNEQHNTFYGDR